MVLLCCTQQTPGHSVDHSEQRAQPYCMWHHSVSSSLMLGDGIFDYRGLDTIVKGHSTPHISSGEG